MVLRRLASKLVTKYATSKLTDKLSPLQLGVGIPGGMEAAIHSARRFAENFDENSVIVKLDYRNAFNSLRRDCLLESALTAIPEAYSYIHASYSSSSHLFYNDQVIQSATGVQQGDPLGPLLFCMTLHPVLSQCDAEIRIGYLDDVTLGGSISLISQNVEYLKEASLNLGLVLNDNKCEIISNSIPQTLPSSVKDFLYVHSSDAVLLGSPLLRGAATQKVLGDRVESLKVAADRLEWLQAHDALTILKHTLSRPSLLHILRSSPCASHASLEEFDDTLRNCLSQMLNVTLNDQQWMQASLPVKDGGLGIRRVAQVAPSAFLASASAAALLIAAILPNRLASTLDTSISQTLTVWTSGRNISPPLLPATSKQKEWDRPIINWQKDQLLSTSPDEVSRARLLAVFSPHSGDWLNAPPLTAVGLRMNNETIRIATGLRLGAPHDFMCTS